jgi:branched-chain amino acid transport system ATP-binding protein
MQPERAEPTLQAEPAATAADRRELLRVDDVHAAYGSVYALEGVSLSLVEGEAVTVLGPNGAGKTTLLRVISGVLPPRQGAVTGAALPPGHASAHAVARSGVAHVPEGRAIFPGLSVSDNLSLGTFALADRADVAQERLDEVLQLFPWMQGRMKQAGGTLSGGEQQMLAIARALMGKPRVLLLDEPSLGLSPLMVNRVFDALAQIRELGVSILLVEQNLTHALELADRGYVMNRGQIVLEGGIEELKQSDLFDHYLAAG